MAETLVLDEFLPAYDHVVSVSQVFRAASEEVFEAAVTMDLYRLPLARVLIAARGLPCRLASPMPGHGVAERRWPRSRRRSG